MSLDALVGVQGAVASLETDGFGFDGDAGSVPCFRASFLRNSSSRSASSATELPSGAFLRFVGIAGHDGGMRDSDSALGGRLSRVSRDTGRHTCMLAEPVGRCLLSVDDLCLCLAMERRSALVAWGSSW